MVSFAALFPRGCVTWLVLLGLALRGWYYFSDVVVWHDEAAQIYNVLNKDWHELLGPLYYSEACPPLFLALEKVVACVLGDGTYALRLLPFLASCAAFLLLVLVARRLLSSAALPWCVLLFACSDRLLWHCCEAKPYAVDVLIAVGALSLFVLRKPGSEASEGASSLFRLILLLAAASPVLVFLSFPACFVLGGAALALLPAVLRSRSARVWGGYAAFGLLLCGSFLVLVLGPVRAQKNERMLSCWIDLFPDWQRPWLVPGLMVQRLTEVFRYALEPVGNVLSLLAVLGGVALWRAGKRRILAVLVLPLALNTLAWLAGQYPLGPARVVAYAAPATFLLIAAGVPAAFALLPSRRHLRLAGAGAIVALLLVPLGLAAFRVAKPWYRFDTLPPVDFVLRHRSVDDVVVGCAWEHAYYFRHLGALYRDLNPKPYEPQWLPPTRRCKVNGSPYCETGPEAVVPRLWVVTWKGEACCQASMARLAPAGVWEVRARVEFNDFTVLYIENRQSSSARPAPVNLAGWARRTAP